MSSASTCRELVLMGSGTLALACTNLVAARGLPLRAVVSQDPALRRWASAYGAAWLAAAGGLLEMEWQSPPILLSISNEQLVTPPVLGLFSRAVNFHDGPLPRYAGSHVTSWALMARERTYAVSWHEMTSRADAGAVLMRVPVPMAADDTALALNARCHEAALRSFPLLLDRLLRGDWAGVRQDLAHRTFFARSHRPDNAAILDWNRRAEELWALVRALSFGPYVNRLGLPKLWLGEFFAAVRSLQVAAARSAAPPGTLISLAGELVRVATTSHDVVLKDFLTLDGRALSVVELVGMARLHEGMVLPVLPATIAKSADRACGWKEEARWIEDLQRLKPAGWPWEGIRARNAPGCDCMVLPAFGARMPASVDPVDFALALVLAWLARTDAAEAFDVGMSSAGADALPAGAHALLACARPFRVEADFCQPFGRFLQDCRARRLAWETRPPYLRDAVMRYPSLVRPRGWTDFASWPVSIELLEDGRRPASTPDTADTIASLRFAIRAPAGEVTLVHSGWCDSQLAKAKDQLATMAQDALARPWASLGELALLAPEEIEALETEVWGRRVSC